MSTAALRLELDDGVDGGQQLGEVVPRLGALVARVQPGDLPLATPCAGWTIRDLLNHLVGGASMYAAALGGAPVRDLSGRLPDVVGDDPQGAFGSAVDTFGAATQQPGAMDRVLVLPVGAMTGRTFLRFAAFDLLVHTWDLGRALGEDVEVPSEVVEPIAAFARHVLEPWPRDGVTFRSAEPAPPGATALQRLVAYSGRTV